MANVIPVKATFTSSTVTGLAEFQSGDTIDISTYLSSSSITFAGDSGSDSASLGETLTISGTANEITTAATSNTITISLPDDVTIGNDLTVSGNLTVSGTTTTVDTTNTIITDKLIELSNGTTGTPSGDVGIVGERGDSANIFIGFDESADEFTFGTGTFTGASTGDLSITKGTISSAGTRIYNSSNYVELVSPSLGGNLSLTLPSADGNSDEVLTTDGSGNLSFAAVSALTGSGIQNISEDSTPQLGGNLDLNGNDIVTTSNANIDLAPNGTGFVEIKGNTNDGTIQLNCTANSHGQKIKAQPHSEAVTNTMLLPKGGNSTLVSEIATQTLTNKTLTSPVLGGTTTTASGNLIIDPATQIVEIKGDGSSVVGQIQLNCHVNSHGQIIASQPHSEGATNTLTLPGGSTIGNDDAVLVSDTGTQTLTNKTITLSGTLTVSASGITFDDGSTQTSAGATNAFAIAQAVALG